MKTTESSKFKQDQIDKSNPRHIKDEHKKQEKISKNNLIEAYDLLWNVNKKNDNTSNGQTLLEEILSNASYVYVEKINPEK